jgi:uncharacterized membrane protein YuzA (DUF378 family)
MVDKKIKEIIMKVLHLISLLLVVIGALNWGLIGIADFNLVKTLFGSYPFVVKTIYILVGLSALVLLVTYSTDCPAVYDIKQDKNK